MKKLNKIEQGKMICGVCGGIAEYFGIDPSIVRIGWVLLSFAFGSGLLAYIIVAIILPDKSKVEQ
jgi:phage shock protein C